MQPRPHHKRRHQKKLRLGEFQELGFPITASCPSQWSDDDRDQAMEKLLDAVESRGLEFGGGDSASGMDGYVARAGRGSATEDDRRALDECLVALGFTDVTVGELEDAWHADDRDLDA